MNKFKELQNKHLALLEKFKEGQSSDELVQEVEAYIEEVKIAGKDIPSSQQRDQLRANLRFWGAFIYERKKVFPDINLWPSTKKNPAGKWRGGKRFLLAVGILSGIILVLITSLAIFRTLLLAATRQEVPNGQSQTNQAATIQVQWTQFAVEKVLSASPTNLPTLTSVGDLPTAIHPLETQANIVLPNSTPPIAESTPNPSAIGTATSSQMLISFAPSKICIRRAIGDIVVIAVYVRNGPSIDSGVLLKAPAMEVGKCPMIGGRNEEDTWYMIDYNQPDPQFRPYEGGWISKDAFDLSTPIFVPEITLTPIPTITDTPTSVPQITPTLSPTPSS